MSELASAVRVPTPPLESQSPIPTASSSRATNGLKRKEAPSRSRSPPSRRLALRDVSPNHRVERDRIRTEKQARAKPMTEEEKIAQAKRDFAKLRSGGAYIPPARLKALQASIPQDTSSEDFQRLAHDARKKTINGLVNKLNVGNLKSIVLECFNENLTKARGLFCMSLMKAQAASPTFTPTYAALVAVINSKLPAIGELLQKRLMIRWAKAFKRNEKAACVSSGQFLAHLCNQNVISYLLLAQMLQLLLTNETDDSVEIAVNLMKEIGQHLEQSNKSITNLIFDRLREILQGSKLEDRTMYAIEVLFKIRRDRFENNPAIPEGLDVIDDDEKITLEPPGPLDEASKLDPENTLNIFKYDPAYEKTEEEWRSLRSAILGEGDSVDEEHSHEEDSTDGGEGAAGGEEESESDDEEEEAEAMAQDAKDMTGQELVKLRKKVYLTLVSSGTFEEAAHKLLKANISSDRVDEVPMMIVESCSQRPTYEKFFGGTAQRLCLVRREMREGFETAFTKYYEAIFRYNNNAVRNIAQFFGHLLGTQAIGWYVLSVITLTEEQTTSSSRVFIKTMLDTMLEEMGRDLLHAKFREPSMQHHFSGLFPTDHPKNTRFAINYFTQIQLGSLTEHLRTYLEDIPKHAPPPLPATSRSTSRSSHSSYTDSSSDSHSRSRSGSFSDSRSPSRSRSPPPRNRGRSPVRGRSYTRSPSSSRSPLPRRRAPRDSRSPSYSPQRRRSRSPRRNRRSLAESTSRSPPRRRPSSSGSRSPPRRRRSPSDSRPVPRRRRYSTSSSRSPRRRRSLSSSRSPPPPRRHGRSPSSSRSRTPPRRRRPGYNRSLTRSRSPLPRRPAQRNPRSRSR